ncbi:DsbA family oxidoreductase [Halopiger aswanensis]|uniref:Putative DsbA family dithiol-disulfide isomerase n=1 Tax=Halopiger aswanensis TaxID=148449 RepID=A0A3R7DZS3_9EURY|nr:DsbA family protein [Halopiger aswanensis]RKD95512.1 putative DsbA family dithiol-disulfide isomerase [Halopiger aswanensis]
MSQQTADAVLVYADYVCPFCFLGYESLDRYREGRDEPLTVDWHPFDLRSQQRGPDGEIDHDVDNGKDDEYYEQAKQNVERLANRYNVELDQYIRKDVDSYDAQRVAWRAADAHPGAFEDFHRSVFDALWREGRDIGEQDVLEDLAADAGLPDGFVAETLSDEASADELEAAFTDAQQTGITGVPTFISGEHAARGAVPPEQLERLIEGT